MGFTVIMASTMPKLQLPEIFQPLLNPKKIKVIYGSRGSGKSMSVADLLLLRVATEGIKVAGMREMMNSIDDSVHALFSDEIDRLGFSGFTVQHNCILHENGGEIRYKGLARNPESVKSMHGFDVFWTEEAATLSKKSLDLLMPTLRKEGSELWFTFNPMSSADPVSKEFLTPFEKEMVNGCYEDDMHLIIKANYNDNPFFPDNLEQLRQKHYETKSRAEYDHIWLGAYNDEVDNSIIKAEWFDACIDAHKIPKLQKAFEPRGAKIAAYDPMDGGADAHGYALRHGSIIKVVAENPKGEIDEGCDWATNKARLDGADWFLWDSDGMGTGLKRQVSTAFKGTKVEFRGYSGALSGSAQDNAEKVYLKLKDDEKQEKLDKPKTYSDVFKNNRAQYYTALADRAYNTYRCVVRGEYVDPDEMLSIDSEGVENLEALRSEVCRIPLKPNQGGLIQIMSKEDMKKLGIDSPNMADSIAMSLWNPPIAKRKKTKNYARIQMA